MNEPHRMSEIPWSSLCIHKCSNEHVLAVHEHEDNEACSSIAKARIAGTLKCGECE